MKLRPAEEKTIHHVEAVLKQSKHECPCGGWERCTSGPAQHTATPGLQQKPGAYRPHFSDNEVHLWSRR